MFESTDINRLRALNERLRSTLAETTSMLVEAHQSEIDDAHGGDTGPCTYCQAIEQANLVLKEAGL